MPMDVGKASFVDKETKILYALQQARRNSDLGAFDFKSTGPVLSNQWSNPTYVLPGAHVESSTWSVKFSGWKFGVYRSAVFAVVVFLVNMIVDLALVLKYNTKQGSGTVFEGSCRTVKATDIAVHLALNICSTLIIGASNYCMQGLCSPTREEVDAQHEKRRWLDIGSQSLRNLRAVRKSNAVMWLVLGFAAVPLHLVFNAVFYTTSQANQYAVAVVTQDFLEASWNATSSNSSPDLFDVELGSSKIYIRADENAVPRLLNNVLHNYQNPANFSFLAKKDCIEAYSGSFVTNSSGVVVVTKARNNTVPLLWARYPESYSAVDMSNNEHFKWMCMDLPLTSKRNGTRTKCKRSIVLEKTDSGRDWTMAGNQVDYCLSQVGQPNMCKLSFNQWLMLMIVVFAGCQTIVMVCMAWRIRKEDDHALRTMGDAVASFIEHEDPTTKGMCLVPTQDLMLYGWRESYAPKTYQKGARPRWSSAPSRMQLWSTYAFILIICGIVGFLIYKAHYGSNYSAFSDGLGRANAKALKQVTDDSDGSTSTIVPTILVANLPQVVFTTLYLAINSLFTRMLLAREWSRFSLRRKELRVTGVQQGFQKSTRMLSIPGKYAIGLMSFAAGVHWIISQSLFFVRVDVVGSDGEYDASDTIARLGYSSLGIAILAALLLSALLVSVAFGYFGKLEAGMPGDGSNSALISAACHLHGEPRGAERGRLIWGDVGRVQYGSAVGHCSFSAVGAVRHPIEGSEYS